MIDSFEKAATLAVEEKQFKQSLNIEAFAFEFYSLMIGYHLYHRLLQSTQAKELHLKAVEDLLERSQSKDSSQ